MKKLLALLATVSLGAAALVATVGQPAEAATNPSKCTTTNIQYWSGLHAYIPSSGGDAGRNCWLVQDANNYNVAVKNLQQQMNYCNRPDTWDPINADGYFGGTTETRLRSTQAYRGVAVDGKYGKNTHNAMGFNWSVTVQGYTYYECARDWAV
ncbi:MAG: peptidoglycan-binding protein [Bifidobacteriaceae bacterium]|jgi:peptidoglycan hydrolase-like protein with peptidoglycan-binding domain|nr:peptidoglycan-binding protein [Bifidobacteriaceae bacterium]